MIRLAAFLAALDRPEQDRARVLTAYLREAPDALPLLTGPAPRRLIPLAALRDWIATETGLPEWLIDASRRATGDLAEALALILPPSGSPEPDLAEPDLAEVLADLAALPPGPLSKTPILAMARRLSPEPRTVYFRLVTGTFRPPVTAALLAQARSLMSAEVRVQAPPLHHIIAVMIYAETTLASGARGPEITLAVWNDGILIPITRAHANLPVQETADLMAWVRSNATRRFGPQRAVPPQRVFHIGFTAVTANRRRKSGLTLSDPQILGWLPDSTASDAADLASLTALLPNTA